MGLCHGWGGYRPHPVMSLILLYPDQLSRQGLCMSYVNAFTGAWSLKLILAAVRDQLWSVSLSSCSLPLRKTSCVTSAKGLAISMPTLGALGSFRFLPVQGLLHSRLSTGREVFIRLRISLQRASAHDAAALVAVHQVRVSREQPTLRTSSSCSAGCQQLQFLVLPVVLSALFSGEPRSLPCSRQHKRCVRCQGNSFR